MRTKCPATIVTLLTLVLSGMAMFAQQTTTPAPAAQSIPATSSSTAPQTSSSNPPAAPPTTNANVPEMSSREDTSTTFKVKVNLVEVRVVVRDAQGNVVRNLRQEDFQLTDNGKPQSIAKFSVVQAPAKPATGGEPIGDTAPGLPLRYVLFLFDDIHLKYADLAMVRDAASRNLRTMQPTDRVAIFTTSAQTEHDFTDDRDQLQATLNQLRPHPVSGSGMQECPDVSYYMADLILNKNDNQAMQVASRNAIACLHIPVSAPNPVQAEVTAAIAVRGAATTVLATGNHEVQVSLAALQSAVRRMAAMPGQRSIILVSPGFYNPDQLQAQTEIADRALHLGIVINAMDARGLYTLTPDASTAGTLNADNEGVNAQYVHQEASADSEVMMDLTNATGGTFIQNSNDFDNGFRRLATPPDYSYLLAFSPQDLKLDGRFHNLKVTVKGQKLNIQARKGYFAPKQAADAAEQAKQQIQEEVFSQEELHDLPVELHTQFFKTSGDDARLSVVVKLDVQHLHYRKVDGRNNNSVIVVSALFDRNGNFVGGNQKTLEMHWKDETLGSKLASGVTLKSSFDVKSGSYMVRLVVRDEEGQLTAQNGAIEIP